MITHSGPTVGAKGNLVAISCRVCEFIHLDPIPDTEIYRDGTYHKVVKPAMLDEHTEDGRWWDAIYGDWFTLIGKHSLSGYRSLLDIGSGTGDFVKAADAWGFKSNGIEPDKDMAALDKDVWNCEYGDVEDNWQWEIISCHWAMEHFYDPSHFLNWTRDKLMEDGLLLATIPNDFSAIQKNAVSQSVLFDSDIADYYWLNEHHVNYWNYDSFYKFLNRHGYDILEVYGSWEPERYLLRGMSYLNNHLLGRRLHSTRKQSDLAMTREERIDKYLKLGREGRGRDLTFLARKI